MFCLKKEKYYFHFGSYKVYLLVLLAVFFSACAKYQYTSAPIDVFKNHQDILLKDHHSPKFKAFLTRHNYPTDDWPIQYWDLKGLTLAAFYFNPEVNVAKAELTVQQTEEIIAKQRQNPVIGVPIEYYDNTTGSPWLAGFLFDFLFERSDKRISKKQKAAAKKDAARIKLHNKVWLLYSKLHQNLIIYSAARKQKKMLEVQRQLLQEKLELLSQHKLFGQISQFELSRVNLELQHIQLQLSEQNYIINNAFYDLVAITGLQVDKFSQNHIQSYSFETNEVMRKYDEKKLRKVLLNNHYDIQIKLKEYDALEAALGLEIMNQYPDINLSPGFVFDQGSNVWALGTAWVLPLFHNHEGEIKRALAKRKHLQMGFIALQTYLLSELSRRHKNHRDKIDSFETGLRLLGDLENKQKQVRKQFDLGYVDKLTLIQTLVEVEKVKQRVFSINVDVLKTHEQLEQVIQQPFNDNGLISEIIKTL